MLHRCHWIVSFSCQIHLLVLSSRVDFRCVDYLVPSGLAFLSCLFFVFPRCLVSSFLALVSSCARLFLRLSLLSSCCPDPPSNGSYSTVARGAEAARSIDPLLPSHAPACPAIAQVRPNWIVGGLRGCWQSTLVLHVLRHRHHDQTKVTADACSRFFRFIQLL